MSNRKIAMHLQSKVSLTLVLLIASFVVVSYTTLRLTIAPAFDELERSAARSDLHRVEGALRADIDNLDAVTADWAPWDDIYNYVGGTNPGFTKSNLNRPTLDNLGLDLMAIYGGGDHLLWAMTLAGGEEIPAHSFNILNPEHPASAGLTSHSDALDRTVGIIATIQGPMIISSHPILRSDDSGPVAGAVVMGQLVNDHRLARISERTEVDLSLGLIAANANPEMAEVIEMTTSVIKASKTLTDIHNTPLLVLGTQTPRNISQLGSQTIDAAMVMLIAAGTIIFAFIWFMLRHMILRPIERLSAHIQDIRQSGDLSRQVSMQREDEIGLLACQFDSLTAQVHDARQALLEQSFKAGKADTAAEVMHNIRNAMTPMINGLERLKKSFKVTENLRVSEAAQQIENPDCAPDRKEKFLEYIVASFDRVETVCSDASDDLNVVTAQAKQVEGILRDQEKFANVAPVTEDLKIDGLLGEAANVIPKEEAKTVELTFEDGLAGLRVHAHRIGLLQVMGNLILNAYESIKRNKTPGGKILLTAADELVNDTPMVRVTVRDNGGGFDEDTGLQIFQRGYTSKTKGETNGLGLHWCANAVASMGGKIIAKSAGNGCGAEFHVVLPASQGG